MQAYENGGHAYHATMPTDAIKHFRDTINETAEFGFDNARDKQQELGDRVRSLLKKHGYISVAADGFLAPGVVVSYTSDKGLHNGSKFKDLGMQNCCWCFHFNVMKGRTTKHFALDFLA